MSALVTLTYLLHGQLDLRVYDFIYAVHFKLLLSLESLEVTCLVVELFLQNKWQVIFQDSL